MNDILLNLSKGIIATGKERKLDAFELIQRDCSSAISNLSRLPITHESINETTRLVNQLGGYSYYIISKIKTGSAISTTDYEQLDTLYDYTVKVQESLNDFQKSINDNFSFVVEMLDNMDENQISTNLASLQSTV
ncbi:MAG: germination protein YpeB, partial [Clostridia bacterium]|nr:germination protein YpeB [Clostridia bacterium]